MIDGLLLDRPSKRSPTMAETGGPIDSKQPCCTHALWGRVGFHLCMGTLAWRPNNQRGKY